MLTDGLFSDPELRALMGAEAQLSTMGRVEAALARAQGMRGIIPADSADRIAKVARSIALDPTALVASAARAGIPAQAFVAALKDACGTDQAFVHYGATSQDIQDSALVLQLREALMVLEERLAELIEELRSKADAHADLVLPARTRFQIAAPTTLGAKIAVWRAPLLRHLERLSELRPRLLNLSLHGAAGTGAAFGPDAAALRADVARDLGLGAPEVPWHAARDAIAELGGWLSLVTGSLGKIGADLILLGQSEVGEIHAGTGGGSSTMPQKCNPVAAEALVSIARLNAGASGTLQGSLVHAQERDGSALAVEWEILPDMLIRTGAALRLALDLSRSLTPNPRRIAETFAADRGAMLAEAAGFYLARHMPRAEAQRIVATALSDMASDSRETLTSALRRLQPGHDWTNILAPEQNTGPGNDINMGGEAT
ncbi:lyase family protein [Paracoccus rhizosphaerae]|uniref:Lyase family protein n=1 Tax=Paracoccus rhizosphaerae TaxID=1133347 RepID=A0ABV6CMN4_9RHOB|nr:lyase family protein [Paracoccus rhizosphaerae]